MLPEISNLPVEEKVPIPSDGEGEISVLFFHITLSPTDITSVDAPALRTVQVLPPSRLYDSPALLKEKEPVSKALNFK